MRNHMAAGQYTLSRFNSPSRGPVDFAVYLPPDWRPDAKDRYPLIFFLHGQDGSEHGFPYVVPATQLNSWIKRELIPPFVLIALRSGRLGTIEEQWSTTRNESLLTSFAPDELRTFALKHFKAGASPETTSIHGHSRGALGALHFALKYPHLFASSVSNSMVSDYALPEEAANAQLYAPNVIASGIRYRISIGDADQFTKELGRRISADTHDLLGRLGIEHEYEILSGVAHDPREVWSYRRANNTPNGLYELRFHARAWGD
jgi:enterochelin esterase-like enzyme